MKKKVFGIAFDSIKIQIHQEPQKNRLNLIFVKDKHTVGEKWPEMVVKWALVIVICFDSEYI